MPTNYTNIPFIFQQNISFTIHFVQMIKNSLVYKREKIVQTNRLKEKQQNRTERSGKKRLGGTALENIPENNKNCFINTKVHQLTHPQGFIYVIIHNGGLAMANNAKKQQIEQKKMRQEKKINSFISLHKMKRSNLA